MSNYSSDSDRPSGLRSRTPSRSRSRRRSAVPDVELIEVNLELMDPANPGHGISGDSTRVTSAENIAKADETRPAMQRFKTTCRAVVMPVAHGFNVATQKLKQRGEDKVGWKRTTLILLTEQVGLALGLAPYVFFELGWFVASLTYIGAAGLCFFTNLTLFRFKRDVGNVESICDVANILLGRVGKFVTLFFLAMCSVMIGAAHIREGGDFWTIAMDGIIWPASEQRTEYRICPEIAGTVITAVFVLIVALPRNFRALSVVSMATVPLTITSVVGTVGRLHADDDSVATRTGIASPAIFNQFGSRDWSIQIIAVLCVLFTFLIQPTSLAVMSDMKNPNDFPNALWYSTLIQCFLFTSVGLAGYAFEGSRLWGGFIFNLLSNAKNDIVLYGMIQPSVVLQAGLFINVLGREMWRAWSLDSFVSLAGGPRFSKYWWSRQGWWMLLLFIQVLIAWLFAASFNDLNSLIGLVASIPGCYFFFLLPAIVAMYVARHSSGGNLPLAHPVLLGMRKRRMVYILQVLTILLGLALLWAGTEISINNFVQRAKINHQGILNPFNCAKHGMEGETVYWPEFQEEGLEGLS